MRTVTLPLVALELSVKRSAAESCCSPALSKILGYAKTSVLCGPRVSHMRSPSGLRVAIWLDPTTRSRWMQGEAASHRWRRWQAAIVHSRDRRASRGRCCRRPTSCCRCRKRSPPLRAHEVDVEHLCAASRASRSKRSAAAHCPAAHSDRHARVSNCSSRTRSRPVCSRAFMGLTTSAKICASAARDKQASVSSPLGVERSALASDSFALNAFFNALAFLKASWIAARPPSCSMARAAAPCIVRTTTMS